MKGKLSLILSGILLTALLVNLVSAASFTLSTNSVTFSQSVSSENFTVTNTNSSVPLTLLIPFLSVPGEGSSTATFTIIGDRNNITTPKQLTISPSIDYSNFKLGKTYSGTLSISNAISSSDTQPLTVKIEKSYCSNGEVGGNLSISEVDINNNGEGDDTTWLPLDEIKLEITVDNNNDDEDDKIDTIVKIGLYSSDGKEQLSLDKLNFGKIKGGDDKTMSVTFDVPADLGIDESDYKLYVKAYQNSKENAICTSDITDISVDREDNEDRYVILKDIIIEPSPASCGTNVILTANAVNIGSDDQDKVKVTLINKELGLNLYQVIDSLDAGDEQNIQFEFKIPQNVSEKSYNLQLVNRYDYNDDYSPENDNGYDQTSDSFYTSIGVANCLTAENAQITAALEPSNQEVKAGNTVTIKATVKNTGTATTTYTFTLPGSEAFSTITSINPPTATLTPGQTQDIFITLKLNDDATGDYTFSIKASFGTQSVTQPVSLSVAGTTAGITGSAILDSIRGNWFIWVIVLINVILIIAIIIVAVRISRA